MSSPEYTKAQELIGLAFLQLESIKLQLADIEQHLRDAASIVNTKLALEPHGPGLPDRGPHGSKDSTRPRA